MKLYKIEGIFEANADGFNVTYTERPDTSAVKDGASKQLKYYCFDFKNSQLMLNLTNRHVDFGYLMSDTRYFDAIAFKPEIFTTKDVVTIESISFQSCRLIASNSNAWCVIFDGNDPSSKPIARTGIPISTKDCIYTFKFLSKVVLHKGTTYCVRFLRTAATDANIPTTRGTNLGSNEFTMRMYGSKTATDPDKCVLMYRRLTDNVTIEVQTTTINGITQYLQPIMSINLA